MAGPRVPGRCVLVSRADCYEVLIHHHEHDMTQILWLLRQLPRQRSVDWPRRPTSRTSEDKALVAPARLLNAGKHEMRYMLSNCIRRWKNAHASSGHGSLREWIEEKTRRANQSLPALERRAYDSSVIAEFRPGMSVIAGAY